VVPLIDAVAKTGASVCYVEVLSKPVLRVRKPSTPEGAASGSSQSSDDKA